MAETIFNFFSFGGDIFALFVISMLPIIELRGAIILGAALGIAWPLALVVCIIGNLLPIPVVIVFGEKLLHWLKGIKPFTKLAIRYEAKVQRIAHTRENYTFWGLLLFVAIPLPGTGAWTGSVVAALLNLPLRMALPAITMGVCVAGVIMTVGSYGLFNFFDFLTTI